MATKVQLQGGAFQDAEGNVLANGYLLFDLNQDCQVNGNTEVVAGIQIKILLNSSGNIQTSPAQFIWSNDVLLPTNNYYTVRGFTAAGQPAWGPNVQQILSSPSPYDVGAWIPNQVTNWSPANAGNEAVQHGGTLVGSRPTVNLIDNGSVNFTVADNAAQNRVDISAVSSGGFNPVDSTIIFLNDDFTNDNSSLIGQYIWNVTQGGGGTNTTLVSTYPHFGVRQLQTTGVSGNLLAIYLYGPGWLGLNTNAGWDSTYVFQADVATNICVRLGIGGAIGNDPPTHGMYVRFDTATDTKFTFECRASGTSTTALSSINGDAGWHRLRVRSVVAGTILFSIDGETEVSIATNVPSAVITPFFQVVTRTTSSKALNIDLFAFKATGLNR